MSGRSRLVSLLWYAAMLGGAAGVFHLVRLRGETLVAPPPLVVGTYGAAAHATGGAQVLPRVLLAMIVIVAAARVTGALFARLRQPPVIGEVVAGIVLGPSLLGRIAPGLTAY